MTYRWSVRSRTKWLWVRIQLQSFITHVYFFIHFVERGLQTSSKCFSFSNYRSDVAKLVSGYKITGDTCRFFSLLSGCNLHLELGTKQSHSKIISNSNENFMVVLQKAKFKMFFRMFNLMNCIWNKWIYLFELASFQKNFTCCLRLYLHACLLA